MSHSLSYRPEVDGLRCFAVLPVILFHLEKHFLPGGYLGVDVFFVISGFLITSIILKELEAGSFSLPRFWDRRVKRILPAASLVLVVSTVVQAAFFYHPDLGRFPMQKFASLFSFANLFFWKDTGSYWGAASESSPYLHYWSLSVEEQYYLFFPLMVMLIHRYRPRWLFPAILLLAGVSALMFFVGSRVSPSATFYFLPTRIWELGAGCLLAVASRGKTWSVGAAGTVAGILLMIAMYVFTGEDAGLGWQAVAVVLGAVLVIAGGSNPVSKLVLENKAAVAIGKISFSLYLWHWPVIVSLRMLADYRGRFVVWPWAVALTLILSLFSYFLVEEKFRRMKRGTPLILACVALIGAFFLIERKLFLNKEYTAGRFDRRSWHGLYYDLKPREDPDPALRAVAANVDAPGPGAPADAFKNGGWIRQRADAYPRVVVLGDSHAAMWCRLIDDITGKMGVTASLWTMNAQDPFFEIPVTDRQFVRQLTIAEKVAYDTNRLRCIEAWKPDLVIFSARWETTDAPRMEALFDFLNRHAKNVLLVESPPVLTGVGDRNFANYASFIGKAPGADGRFFWPDGRPEKVAELRGKMMALVSKRPRFSWLPVADLYTDGKVILAGIERTIHYLDDDHLTDAGTEISRERFSVAIRKLLAEVPGPSRLN